MPPASNTSSSTLKETDVRLEALAVKYGEAQSTSPVGLWYSRLALAVDANPLLTTSRPRRHRSR